MTRSPVTGTVTTPMCTSCCPIPPTPNGTNPSERISAARTRDCTIANVRPRIESSTSVPMRVNPAR